MEMTNKNLLEKIKDNVEQMKRFRPTLREQVEEVLNNVTEQVIKAGARYHIEIDKREFFIGECYINCEYENLCTENEFVEICGGHYEPDYIKGFNGDYTFSNKDIIFLAQNIEEILQQINNKLDSSNKRLKPLTEKMDKVLNVLKNEENTKEVK